MMIRFKPRKGVSDGISGSVLSPFRICGVSGVSGKAVVTALTVLVFQVFLTLPVMALEVVAYAHKSVTVSSPVAGLLTEMLVDEGEQVVKDVPLARLDSMEDELEIRRLEKILEKKRFDTRGLEKLLADDMTSKDEALQARMEKELTEIELTRARLRHERKSILSPLDGSVVNRYHQAGEWVSTGEPLFQIIDMKTMKCRIFLRVNQSESFELNQSLQLTFPEPVGRTSGKVVYIDPRFDVASGLCRMEILVDNPSLTLRPGVRGELKVSDADREKRP
ncbi:MAG: hypothetical protein CVV64_12600 [Candidatus Wallbacteria bacterium HGW-Wallbacteria-1]|jgi:RND family efflux transporter MFP subunit|uniref:Multidrug resistance protein MdtA-like barrel-sandwich hybrid domain-containing protein n=1 Tax=Candidatus Wallbacteria bacterium HGW-Wallbacteria-1 TaxID=2013854 RepID=A0A2N1PNC2_9BACT|nr:MAG: hypothetical protein CVV64_12600 [Candidatus Wallbacteria bacterium HGW-Wallbacteria-1]